MSLADYILIADIKVCSPELDKLRNANPRICKNLDQQRCSRPVRLGVSDKPLILFLAYCIVAKSLVLRFQPLELVSAIIQIFEQLVHSGISEVYGLDLEIVFKISPVFVQILLVQLAVFRKELPGGKGVAVYRAFRSSLAVQPVPEIADVEIISISQS